MSRKKPRIKIDKERSWETDNAVYLVVEFDYGVKTIKTQINIAKPVTKDDIRRSLLRAYDQLKPKGKVDISTLEDIE